MTKADMINNTHPSPIYLYDDGEGVQIEHHDVRNRTLHRLLAAVEPGQRSLVLTDAIVQGSELLARAGRHGELEQLTAAVDRLDGESSRIVVAATQRFEH